MGIKGFHEERHPTEEHTHTRSWNLAGGPQGWEGRVNEIVSLLPGKRRQLIVFLPLSLYVFMIFLCKIFLLYSLVNSEIFSRHRSQPSLFIPVLSQYMIYPIPSKIALKTIFMEITLKFNYQHYSPLSPRPVYQTTSLFPSFRYVKAPTNLSAQTRISFPYEILDFPTSLSEKALPFISCWCQKLEVIHDYFFPTQHQIHLFLLVLLAKMLSLTLHYSHNYPPWPGSLWELPS